MSREQATRGEWARHEPCVGPAPEVAMLRSSFSWVVPWAAAVGVACEPVPAEPTTPEEAPSPALECPAAPVVEARRIFDITRHAGALALATDDGVLLVGDDDGEALLGAGPFYRVKSRDGVLYASSDTEVVRFDAAGPVSLAEAAFFVADFEVTGGGAVVFVAEDQPYQLRRVVPGADVDEVILDLELDGDSMAVRGDELWIGAVGDGLYRVPVDGGAPERVLAFEDAGSLLQSLVATDTSIFYSDRQSPHRIRRYDIETGDVDVVSDDAGAPMDVVADGDFVYWSILDPEGVSSRIIAVPEAGGVVQTVADCIVEPGAMHADPDAFYVVENATNAEAGPTALTVLKRR